MQEQKIKTIIFDLGGVLIDWNPKRLYKKIFAEEQEMDKFLAEVCTMDWNEQQDAGRSIAEANAILIEQFPEYENEIKAYYGRWEEMLGGAIEGTVAILKYLKNKTNYRLYALTNWSAETFPIALERFDFLQLFEGILVSGKEGLKKPDLRIYQLILDRYEINPASTMFIDDNARNIEAAREVGIDAVHFVSPEALEAELSERAILVNA